MEMGPSTTAQGVEQIKEKLGRLEETISEMVSKAFERAIDAMHHSLSEMLLEGQAKASRQLGADLDSLAGRLEGSVSKNNTSPNSMTAFMSSGGFDQGIGGKQESDDGGYLGYGGCAFGVPMNGGLSGNRGMRGNGGTGMAGGINVGNENVQDQSCEEWNMLQEINGLNDVSSIVSEENLFNFDPGGYEQKNGCGKVRLDDLAIIISVDGVGFENEEVKGAGEIEDSRDNDKDGSRLKPSKTLDTDVYITEILKLDTGGDAANHRGIPVEIIDDKIITHGKILLSVPIEITNSSNASKGYFGQHMEAFIMLKDIIDCKTLMSDFPFILSSADVKRASSEKIEDILKGQSGKQTETSIEIKYESVDAHNRFDLTRYIAQEANFGTSHSRLGLTLDEDPGTHEAYFKICDIYSKYEGTQLLFCTFFPKLRFNHKNNKIVINAYGLHDLYSISSDENMFVFDPGGYEEMRQPSCFINILKEIVRIKEVKPYEIAMIISDCDPPVVFSKGIVAQVNRTGFESASAENDRDMSIVNMVYIFVKVVGYKKSEDGGMIGEGVLIDKSMRDTYIKVFQVVSHTETLQMGVGQDIPATITVIHDSHRYVKFYIWEHVYLVGIEASEQVVLKKVHSVLNLSQEPRRMFEETPGTQVYCIKVYDCPNIGCKSTNIANIAILSILRTILQYPTFHLEDKVTFLGPG